MADVKYALDDNIKQNVLEPLHHLQTKDLKEVMVRMIGLWLFVALFYSRNPFSTTGKSYKVGAWTLTVNGGVRRKVREIERGKVTAEAALRYHFV